MIELEARSVNCSLPDRSCTAPKNPMQIVEDEVIRNINVIVLEAQRASKNMADKIIAEVGISGKDGLVTPTTTDIWGRTTIDNSTSRKLNVQQRVNNTLTSVLSMVGMGRLMVQANLGAVKPDATNNQSIPAKTLNMDANNTPGQAALNDLQDGNMQEQIQTPEGQPQTPGWQFVKYNAALDQYETVNMDQQPYENLLNRIDFVSKAKMKELYPDTPDNANYLYVMDTELDANNNIVPTIAPVPIPGDTEETTFTPYVAVLLGPDGLPLHAIGTADDGKAHDLGLTALLANTNLTRPELDFTSPDSYTIGQIFVPTKTGEIDFAVNGRTTTAAKSSLQNGDIVWDVTFKKDPTTGNWNLNSGPIAPELPTNTRDWTGISIRDTTKETVTVNGELKPGVYRIKGYDGVRVVGNNERIFQGGLIPDDNDVWYVQLDIDSQKPLYVVLGPDTWTSGITPIDLDGAGKPALGFQVLSGVDSTRELIDYLKNNPNMPIVIDYQMNINDLVNSTRGSGDCDAECQMKLHYYDTTNTNGLVQQLSTIDPGSKYTGSLSTNIILGWKYYIPDYKFNGSSPA